MAASIWLSPAALCDCYRVSSPLLLGMVVTAWDVGPGIDVICAAELLSRNRLWFTACQVWRGLGGVWAAAPFVSFHRRISKMTQRKPTKLPLLRSESAAEFLALRHRLQQEINPNGAIEEIYLEDIAALVWEIQRLRHFRISAIHLAFPQALKRVLEQLMFVSNILERVANEIEAARLAQGWIENDEADRKQVAEMLRQFHLDESAFEAEAMRLIADQLEYLDRALVTARSRLDKALRLIMDYRESLAIRLRHQTDHILQGQPNHGAICIEHDAEQKDAA
jgi:hypothetical protein